MPDAKHCATGQGFTLLELVFALAITALLMALAVPTYASLVARQRLKATVEHLRADIGLARQEAARRALPVHLVFQPGNPWCYALGTTAQADCRVSLQPGVDPSLIKVVHGRDQPGVQLLLARAMAIDSRNGASLHAHGMARFASAEGQQLQVRLGQLGHASVCAPAAAVAGEPACPAGDLAR